MTNSTLVRSLAGFVAFLMFWFFLMPWGSFPAAIALLSGKLLSKALLDPEPSRPRRRARVAIACGFILASLLVATVPSRPGFAENPPNPVVQPATLAAPPAPPSCSVSCADLRRASPRLKILRSNHQQAAFHGMAARGLFALGFALFGLLLGGGNALSVRTASVTVGGLLALAPCAGLFYAQLAASRAQTDAAQWVADPNNLCIGCGYAEETRGFRADIASDTCWDPDCAAQ